MKTLYLIRHAKSDWNILSLSDIDRSLNTRGYKDAHIMSAFLNKKKVLPAVIVTSPAIRAVSTALIFSRNLGIDVSELIINTDLYHSTTDAYFRVIAKTSNKYDNLLLFGHNPIITDFANMLTKPFSDDIPTCSISCIQFDVTDWEKIKETKGELLFFDSPKNHS